MADDKKRGERDWSSKPGAARKASGGGAPRSAKSGKASGSRSAGTSGGKTKGKGKGGKGRSDSDRAPKPVPRRRDLSGAAANLPNWVVRDLTRVTPKERVGPALEALGEASAALAEGRNHVAVKHAKRAKSLAPRDATVRETYGLAAYRIGDWTTALAELRAYRRLAGDTVHLPIEIDVLRALGRSDGVRQSWATLRALGGRPITLKEGAVVYASFLLDEGDVDGAWALTRPKNLGGSPSEADLRVWYVAARAALRRGEVATARRIADAIVTADPGFPGLDELDQEISGAR